MNSIPKILGALVIILSLGISCSGDDPELPRSELNLRLSMLESLKNGYQYEGWLMVNGSPVSVGKFNDVSSSRTFIALASDVANASSFFVSIEPNNDTDPQPSNTKVLSGSFIGNAASLSYVSEIGDLLTAQGRFTLSTPTDNNSNSTPNDEFGVWFEANGNPGLTLPTLPEGWKYEGWVVFGNAFVTTAPFREVDQPDEFNPFSGTDARPSVPGEDFLNPSVAPAGVTFPGDVRGKTVFISVEPFPDDDARAPFSIKPLLFSGNASDPNDLKPDTDMVNTMELNNASFPSGTITR